MPTGNAGARHRRRKRFARPLQHGLLPRAHPQLPARQPPPATTASSRAKHRRHRLRRPVLPAAGPTRVPPSRRRPPRCRSMTPSRTASTHRPDPPPRYRPARTQQADVLPNRWLLRSTSLISAFCVNKHGPKCGPAGRSPRLAARFLSGAGRRQEASPTMPQKGHGRRPGVCGASVTGLAGEVERVRRLGGQDRGLGRARKDRGRGSLRATDPSPRVSHPQDAGARTVVGVVRLRRAAVVRVRRGRPDQGRTASWRSERAGRGCVGGRCAPRWPAPAGCRPRDGCGCHRRPCG